uniref:RNA-dependent RNA polymerase n=1 Tax=Luoyang Botou tick virus 1 TaxID=2972051 RepID=A0A9E8A9H1_9VIRU|nr:MAG: RNA-dependent RNA polymerase [Luoyang Botou tick virus 1]
MHMSKCASAASVKEGFKSRSCRAYRHRTIEYLDRAVASWQAIFAKTVDVPGFEGARSCADFAGLVKRFLGRDVSDVPREQLSFQSIKKGLPSSCPCMEDGMLDKLARSISSPPRNLPPGYLDFVRKEITQLFKKGWDASYESFCLTTSPPLSAVFKKDDPVASALRGAPLCSAAGSRSTGGCLGWLGASQEEFLSCVLHGEGSVGELQGKLILVQSAGKPRPLSKFSADSLALKPLHKTIYGFLKRFPWLLVGDPTRERLQKAGFKEGRGSLVSGDYASATDGLSIEVAEVILETLLSSSVFVPPCIKEAAISALRPLLFYGDDDVEVRVSTGQMMGSYLSFPLLCLQNYLAFRWSLRGLGIRRRVPVLINGDDILFQLSDHFDRWESCLGPLGLTVERTKTSVESEWGTINSTLLRWVDGYLSPAWSARFGMFRPAEHPGGLGSSFLSFLSGCDEPDLRFRAGREFFRWHLSELRSSGVSPVSLGFRGLLARRLSKLYSLLELPLSELPRAFKKHDVCYDEDFVTRVDVGAFGPEELFQSSLELGSMKWNRGWRPLDVTREAVRYCLSMTEAKARREDPPDLSFFWCSDQEFSYRARNLRPLRRTVVSSKAFLAPFPPPEEVIVSWSVFRDLTPQMGEFEELPAYRAVEELPPGW